MQFFGGVEAVYYGIVQVENCIKRCCNIIYCIPALYKSWNFGLGRNGRFLEIDFIFT